MPPDDRTKRAWNNTDDATRDGAYVMCLAAVEVEMSLVAIGRADTRTGADYYLAPLGDPQDLEAAYRLEVSGLDHGGPGNIRQRLREKVNQTRRGKSNLPAIASVVGFLSKRIEI